jgi:hypothetical protein
MLSEIRGSRKQGYKFATCKAYKITKIFKLNGFQSSKHLILDEDIV